MINSSEDKKWGGYLRSVQYCQEQQDPAITHEFIINEKPESVRLANYLRNHGYTVEREEKYVPEMGTVYYVGVPFETLKK